MELATVTIREGKSQEQLLKRFRRKVQQERVLSDARRKRFFVSKSELRRIALRKAERSEQRRRSRAQRRRRR